MAEGGVEDASVAESAHPGDREETFLLRFVRVVAHEPDRAHLVAILIFDEIHFLLGEGPDVPDVAIGWMLLVPRLEGGGDLGAVSIEGPAEHVGKGKRVLQRITARVHADERTAGFHPVGKPLEIRQGQRSRSVAKNHGIDAVVAQGLRRERLKGFRHGGIELGGLSIGLRLHVAVPRLHGLLVRCELGVVFFQLGLRGVWCGFAGRLGRLGNLDIRLPEPGDDLEVR